MKYGPTRGELWFRLGFSLAGLGLLAVAVAYRGIPSGPALVEVIGVAGLFFGGTAVWAGARLFRDRPSAEAAPGRPAPEPSNPGPRTPRR